MACLRTDRHPRPHIVAGICQIGWAPAIWRPELGNKMLPQGFCGPTCGWKRALAKSAVAGSLQLAAGWQFGGTTSRGRLRHASWLRGKHCAVLAVGLYAATGRPILGLHVFDRPTEPNLQ